MRRLLCRLDTESEWTEKGKATKREHKQVHTHTQSSSIGTFVLAFIHSQVPFFAFVAAVQLICSHANVLLVSSIEPINKLHCTCLAESPPTELDDDSRKGTWEGEEEGVAVCLLCSLPPLFLFDDCRMSACVCVFVCFFLQSCSGQVVILTSSLLQLI